MNTRQNNDTPLVVTNNNSDEHIAYINKNDEKDHIHFDYKHQNLNFLTIFQVTFLMAAPLIMGICINSLGHQDLIDTYFISTTMHDKKYFGNLRSVGVLFPLGGLFAATSSSIICDKFGKKKPTIFFFVMSLIGFALKFSSYYSTYILLYSGRLFDGLASGGLMVTAVSWMFDLLPRRIHIAYKPMLQIFINAGIVIIACFSLEQLTRSQWHLSYLTQFIITIIAMIMALFLPESHVYIYSKNRDRIQLEVNLKKIRKNGYDINEVNELVRNIENSLKLKSMSVKQFITTRRFHAPLSAAIALNIFQQAGGINVVVAFTTTLLSGNDKGHEALLRSYIYTIYILLVGFVGSIVAAPLVGKYPRKIMLIIGFLGMTLSFIGVIIINTYIYNKYALIAMYAIFFVIFQVGPGPLVWFICIEIFPPEAVSSAQGVATVANWFANSCVFFLYPIVYNQIGDKSIYIFTVINSIALFYTIFGVEETNNKEPENILDGYDQRYRCFRK